MSMIFGLTRLFLLSLVLLVLTGCGTPQSPSGKKIGDLTIRSLVNENLSLTGQFQAGYYQFHDENRITLVLMEGSEEAPDQVLIVRMLWLPRGSKTPVNRNATNAAIKHIIFAGVNHEIVGIYGGGGYYYPKQTPGKNTIKGAIWDGSMALQHQTAGFADRLGRVQIDGKITITREDEKVQALLKSMEEDLSRKMGYKINL